MRTDFIRTARTLRAILMFRNVELSPRASYITALIPIARRTAGNDEVQSIIFYVSCSLPVNLLYRCTFSLRRIVKQYRSHYMSTYVNLLIILTKHMYYTYIYVHACDICTYVNMLIKICITYTSLNKKRVKKYNMMTCLVLMALLSVRGTCMRLSFW